MQNIEVNVHDALQEHFVPYAGEILLNNLPSIDGCLPVHRKVMLSMFRNGRYYNKPHSKSTKVLGEIVTYYVFGDAPLYGAMVNMANNSMNIPYVDGYGQWGEKFSAKGVPAAARYTECRMSKYAQDMIEGLSKNSVPMKPNFDNTTDEMITMPSLPPNILLNTSQSIAVGEASKIPAHNVNDTCDSIINYINTRNIDSAIQIIKCPDLSSGGQVVYDKEKFNTIYKTGKGSFTLIGKYKYDEKINAVQIYEVPY
jgi:DNA gyrase subunit A